MGALEGGSKSLFSPLALIGVQLFYYTKKSHIAYKSRLMVVYKLFLFLVHRSVF